MDTLQNTIPPPDTAPAQNSTVLLGIALAMVIPGFPPLEIPTMMLGAIRAGLRRAGIDNEPAGTMYGRGFALCLVKVADSNPALRSIRETLQDLGFLDRCEIAFSDSEGEPWRTVQPEGAKPFERFLTDEKLRLALEAALLEVKVTEALLRFAEQMNQKQNAPPSDNCSQ
jgi:hypothetical protein